MIKSSSFLARMCRGNISIVLGRAGVPLYVCIWLCAQGESSTHVSVHLLVSGSYGSHEQQVSGNLATACPVVYIVAYIAYTDCIYRLYT